MLVLGRTGGEITRRFNQYTLLIFSSINNHTPVYVGSVNEYVPYFMYAITRSTLSFYDTQKIQARDGIGQHGVENQVGGHYIQQQDGQTAENDRQQNESRFSRLPVQYNVPWAPLATSSKVVI